MQTVKFCVNGEFVTFTGITSVEDIETVVQELGADFVVRAINRAIRDRALRNWQAGVNPNELGGK